MPGKRTLFIALGVVIGLVILLTIVPIPNQSFHRDGAEIDDLWSRCDDGVAATRGTTVSFQWSTEGPTDFFVVSCSQHDGQAVYHANGTHGSGSFVSAGGSYKFGAACPGPTPCYPATVSGTRTGPILSLSKW